MKTIHYLESYLKVKKSHLHLGFDCACFLAWVAEFEAQGKTCFASRQFIAHQLGLSESSVQRIIRKLSTTGHLTVTYQKNQRVLHTTEGSNLTQQGIQIEPPRGSKLTHKGIQIDSIQRNKIQRNIYTKKQNTNINNKNNNNNIIQVLVHSDPPEEAPKTDTLNAAAAKFGLRKRWE